MTRFLMAVVLAAGTPVGLGADRAIQQFDFEEALLRPLTMPLAFEQVGERGVGTDFPRFGEMSLTEENPYTGRFAFRFDLKGRSMAARTLPGMIPVLPMVDHRISLQVRTTDLERAGVRVVAWLEDSEGKAIDTSRSVSEVLQETEANRNQWQPLSVVVPGHAREAAELVVELQLVQPDLQSGTPQPMERTRPSLEDISGVAVFDDIVIETWPRLYLADPSRIGLHTGGPPVVHLRIDDPARGQVNWHLEVMDSHGQRVHTMTGRVPGDGLDKTLTLPLEKRDWYQVKASLDEPDRVMIQDELTLAVLNESIVNHAEPRIRLDLTGTESNGGQAALAVDLLGHLGPGEAVIPVWHANVTFQDSWPETLKHVDELMRLGIEPMLALNWIPPNHRAKGPFDSRDAARFLATHPETLDGTVNAAVIAWGDSASRWRIGRQEDAKHHLDAAIASLHERLKGLVVNLDITAAGLVPLQEATNTPPRQQMQRSAIQLIEDWCADQSTILIAAPWQRGTRGLEPTPTYPILQTLIRALAGRSDVAILPVSPGLEARLLEGGDRAPIIIAWRSPDQDNSSETLALRLPMDATLVQCQDALGNAISCQQARHDAIVPIDDLPVIIEGFSTPTIRLLAQLEIEPPQLEASLRVHDHVLTLENTLPGSMHGHLIANAGEGVTIRPSVIGLDLPRGGKLTMPIEIIVTTPLPSGPLEVNLDIRLDTGRRIPMTTWLDVGLPGLEVQWSRRNAPNTEDLLIDLQVRNLGTSNRRLHATLAHPELDMTTPARLQIDPAGTIAQTFRIPGGVSTLEGGVIALLLEDPDGDGRLREVLVVPEPERTVLVDEPSTP
ncbi:MAG: hypothetical protein VX527_11750 [Planctomycetota bacterium]|nr:hypothetical protein [Planctomycetota bacterium]